MKPISAKFFFLRLWSAGLSSLMFFSVLAHAGSEDCSARILPKPNARDLLVLKAESNYHNPEFKGVNLRATLSTQRREIACPSSAPEPFVKCYSSISLYGRAAEGDQLRIPVGAEINVSRINSRANEIFLYPRKVDGLQRTRSGTFRLTCSRYHVRTLPGEDSVTYNNRRFPCFNADIDLLFENKTLNSCLEHKPSAPPVRDSNPSAPKRWQRATGSSGSSIE